MHAHTPVLELINASVIYESSAGPVQAVNQVNLTVMPNEIVGLIGESGSGKSTMAYAIMRLLRGNAYLSDGSIRVLGRDVYEMNQQELRQFRWRHMSMVFQSAMSALNPVITVETQLVDTLRSHRRNMTLAEAKERAAELLDLVRIDRVNLKSYPHQLSGGMRQRVVIAIAIALEPELVIMDEPTTALDVVVQRSILNRLQEIQAEKQFSVLFISHDFSLVSELSSRIAIMYAGRIVEETRAVTLRSFDGHHPYTEGLLKAVPRLTVDDITIQGIKGHPPDLVDLPVGCAFHPRCLRAIDTCRKVRPVVLKTDSGRVECHLFADKEAL